MAMGRPLKRQQPDAETPPEPPAPKSPLDRTSKGYLSYEVERFALHVAAGCSVAQAEIRARDDAGLKKTNLRKYAQDPLVIDRIAELQAELVETSGIDMQWVMGEMVKQYRKCDLEGDRTNARLNLKQIGAVVDYQDQRRQRDEIENQTEWDGLSEERQDAEIERLIRIASPLEVESGETVEARAEVLHRVHEPEADAAGSPAEDGAAAGPSEPRRPGPIDVVSAAEARKEYPR